MRTAIAVQTIPPAPRRPRPEAPSRAPLACCLTLSIEGTDYDLSPIAGGRRLRKADGTAYHAVDEDGERRCDCPAWIHGGRKDPCKHLRALIERGVIARG